MNGALAVSRYTLIELSRRRILLVLFIIGVLGIAVIGAAMKIQSQNSPSFTFGGPPGSPQPSAEAINRLTELSFVMALTQVVGFFSLLIAFAIGMTAIYHDLESGAAVGIFSKPVSRAAFTAGKVLAALVSIVVIVGLLSLETLLAMTLFGGGLEQALYVETVAAVANALLIMLIVLALSTLMNNIIAAVVAFIYYVVSMFVFQIHTQMVAGNLGDNEILKAAVNIGYWVVPHPLVSDIQRQLAQANYDLFASMSGQEGGPPPGQFINYAPPGSGIQDIIWWAFLVVLIAGLVYVAVRRRQV